MDLREAYYYELIQRYGDGAGIERNWTEEQRREDDRLQDEICEFFRAGGSVGMSDFRAIFREVSVMYMPTDWKPSPTMVAHFEELERKKREAELLLVESGGRSGYPLLIVAVFGGGC